MRKGSHHRGELTLDEKTHIGPNERPVIPPECVRERYANPNPQEERNRRQYHEWYWDVYESRWIQSILCNIWIDYHTHSECGSDERADVEEDMDW